VQARDRHPTQRPYVNNPQQRSIRVALALARVTSLSDARRSAYGCSHLTLVYRNSLCYADEIAVAPAQYVLNIVTVIQEARMLTVGVKRETTSLSTVDLSSADCVQLHTSVHTTMQ
jgi:hypothetical protein